MKLHSLPQPARRQRGSILAMTLIVTGIIGFTLASYLSLISAQNRSTYRSLTWNSTMPLIEAGIEEALAHLNSEGVTNLVSQGWQGQGNLAVLSRDLGDGRFTVTITTNSPAPTIDCTAYVPAPVWARRESSIFYAQVNVSVDTAKQTKTEVARSVRVTASNNSGPFKGLVAKDGIDNSGNNVFFDSYDSGQPGFRSDANGQYSSGFNNDNGYVASNSGWVNGKASLQIGNADIMGSVASANNVEAVVGSNGSIGDRNHLSSGGTGVQSGHWSGDMNMSFPPVEVPSAVWTTPPTTNTTIIVGTNYVTNIFSVVDTNLGPPAGYHNRASAFVTLTNATMPSPPHIDLTVTSVVFVSACPPTSAPPGSVTIQRFTNNYAVTPSGGVCFNCVSSNTASLTQPAYPTGYTIVTLSTNVGASNNLYYGSTTAGPPSFPPAAFPNPTNYFGLLTLWYKSTGAAATRGWYKGYRSISGYTFTYRQFQCVTNIYHYTNTAYTYKVPTAWDYDIVVATPITTNVNGVVLGNGNYSMSGFNATGGGRNQDTMFVTGKATLKINGDMSISGNGGIVIFPGASLTIYLDGNLDIAGNGVMNESGFASGLTIYGTANCTSIRAHGNAMFKGAIYAPDASLAIGGGGNDENDFQGAAVVKDAKLNGKVQFHYDEYLGRMNKDNRYIITGWWEIANWQTYLSRTTSSGYESSGSTFQNTTR